MSPVKEYDHLKIRLEAIKSATNNFAAENCIGSGGFGVVYKGKIAHSGGQSVAAFKRLNPKFGQGNTEFWNEIMMLSVYTHENIVRLLGFCDESEEMILVYEYASRESLDKYLHKDEPTWIQRLKICIGVARGLAYLHNPLKGLRVFHCDIKSSNILLDEEWNARISDFGLSKFGPANNNFSYVFSNPSGTIGYGDPLYVEKGCLTKESDVYSLGVMLFEVLCGRLCVSNRKSVLTRLVRECYDQGNINDIIHDKIKDEIDLESLKQFTEIGYQCLKEYREDRPLMATVVTTLESALKFQEADSRMLLAMAPQWPVQIVTRTDFATPSYDGYPPWNQQMVNKDVGKENQSYDGYPTSKEKMAKGKGEHRHVKWHNHVECVHSDEKTFNKESRKVEHRYNGWVSSKESMVMHESGKREQSGVEWQKYDDWSSYGT